MKRDSKTKRKGIVSRSVGFIRSALTENLGLKVVCFFCAFVLVAYQRSGEETKTRSVAFQVDAQLPPENAHRELMTTLPPTVNVTVEGSGRALDELATRQNSIGLDLRDGRTEQIKFTHSQFDIPPGVRIKRLDPPKVELDWQDIITRRVPIQSSVTGVVAPGFDVAEISVAPESVQLRGPANLVNVTQFVRVAPFDVTGLSEGSPGRLLALDPPPDRTYYVGSSNVTVRVTVKRRLITASFSRVPVEIVGAPGAKATPPGVDISVVGPPEVIKALGRELVVPRVELGDRDLQNHGSAVLPVTVELTNAKAEIQPPTITVQW